MACDVSPVAMFLISITDLSVLDMYGIGYCMVRFWLFFISWSENTLLQINLGEPPQAPGTNEHMGKEEKNFLLNIENHFGKKWYGERQDD